jgi:uncharacterized membrane protein
MKPRIRTILKTVFRTGITLKGIDGLLEILGGVLLWFIHPSAMNALLRVLSQHDLSRDPHDFIAVRLLHTSRMLLSGNRLFPSLFLLSHGIAKVVLVVAMWMKELWAYPLTIFVFSAFSAYQLYRCSHTHSISLFILTIFDVVVIALTWQQWRQLTIFRNATTSSTPN